MQLSHKQIDTIGGITMIVAMLIALLLSNVSTFYSEVINSPIQILASYFAIDTSIAIVSKDVLMVIFFAYIGMELRMEFHDGSLSNKRQIILPLFAAIGGMIVPAIIYLGININHPVNYSGFAIPMATDIAFAICLFNLIGKTLPASSRIFLLSIAIFDDIGAIIIIALFYSSSFNLLWFFASCGLLGILILASYYKITSNILYISALILLSILFHHAGLHTTLAGFALGFILPLTKKSGVQYLKKIMYKIHPLVQFVVLPMFALTASGIVFSGINSSYLLNPLLIGIVLGLFIGKPLGITLFSYLTIKFGLAKLPDKNNMQHIFLVSVFAGIGFTMSLFIGMLFSGGSEIQNLIKIGVLAGSFLSVLLAVILRNYIKNLA